MIEVNGIIYRNLEEQVQKNKEDIEALQNEQSGDDVNIEQINERLEDVETNLTEITPDVMRALKTPLVTPNQTKLVAVDTTNSQELLNIGNGLIISDGSLVATGVDFEIVDNLQSTSTISALSANQGRILNNTITTIDGEVSNNTEQIEFLQSDVAEKTNVTINNVHQDYINFDSNPQTQISQNTSEIQTIKNDYVTKDTAQTISGKKTYTQNNIVKADNIDINSNPTSNQYKYFDFYDKNNNRMGVIGARMTPDGYVGCYMQAKSNTAIGILINPNGSIRTFAPIPSANSNDDNIAVTSWVNTNVNGKVNNFSMVPKNVYSTQTITTSGTQIRSPIHGYIRVNTAGMSSDGYIGIISSSGLGFTQNAGRGNYPVYYLPVNSQDLITINFNGTDQITIQFIQCVQI